MATVVEIAGCKVGENQPCFVVAEIGINHNGSLETAKQLIDAAVECGCNAVKFQKRTVSVVYTDDDLNRKRDSPFGSTNRDLKMGLEFGLDHYLEIDRYCREKSIRWYASCWDEESVDFMAGLDCPCYKIASASLTDDNLLRHHSQYGRPIVLSTGMSTVQQIDRAVEILGTESLILLHTTSTYPSQVEELNLRVIKTLRRRYGVPIGYSGHEIGLAPSLAAVALDACMIERHITLDRAMWGSDQAASVEPQGFRRLVKDIRAIELAMGDGTKRVWDNEIPVMQKLRRVGL
jgi:N-acetylneuraminate synthase